MFSFSEKININNKYLKSNNGVFIGEFSFVEKLNFPLVQYGSAKSAEPTSSLPFHTWA